MLTQMVSMNRSLTEPAVKAVAKRVIRVPSNGILGKVARVLELDPCLIVVDKESKLLLKDFCFKCTFGLLIS